MSTGPLPPGETYAPPPRDCSVCNHSGKVVACMGCGGLTGGNGWGPCTYCAVKIGEEQQQNNPPPMMPPEEVITSWGLLPQIGTPWTYSAGLESIEATEPRTLPPLEAFAAEAATNVPSDLEPDEVLAYEIQCLQHAVLSLEEKIGELSKSIAALTQAVLGRNT